MSEPDGGTPPEIQGPDVVAPDGMLTNLLGGFVGFCVSAAGVGFATFMLGAMTLFTMGTRPKPVLVWLYIGTVTALLAGAIVAIVALARRQRTPAWLYGMVLGAVVALLVAEACGTFSLPQLFKG